MKNSILIEAFKELDAIKWRQDKFYQLNLRAAVIDWEDKEAVAKLLSDQDAVRNANDPSSRQRANVLFDRKV